METKTILILGGYGNTGLQITRLLKQETDVRVILAGRNRGKASEVATNLNKEFGGTPVAACEVDATDEQALVKALEGVDMLVVASGTSKYTGTIARAALRAGSDYLDLQYSSEKLKTLQALAPEIERAGGCFITEAGFHPGLAATAARYVAEGLEGPLKVWVSGSVNLSSILPQSIETLYEFIDEFRFARVEMYRAGSWQLLDPNDMKNIRKEDFGPEFGVNYNMPMMLEEMRALPDYLPGLQETGFFISDVNKVINWVVFPLISMYLGWKGEKATVPASKFMLWSMKTFRRPPHGAVLKATAQGYCGGKPRQKEIWFYHPDGYFLTAVPVVAGLLQYLDGSAAKPGLWMLGHLSEPQRAVRDIERLGVTLRCRESTNFPNK